MVVIRCEELVCIFAWNAMYQDVVDRLNIERFLYFSVRRDPEVEQNESRDKGVESPLYPRHGINDSPRASTELTDVLKRVMLTDS